VNPLKNNCNICHHSQLPFPGGGVVEGLTGLCTGPLGTGGTGCSGVHVGGILLIFWPSRNNSRLGGPQAAEHGPGIHCQCKPLANQRCSQWTLLPLRHRSSHPPSQSHLWLRQRTVVVDPLQWLLPASLGLLGFTQLSHVSKPLGSAYVSGLLLT
jgi:hypothetical protein